MSVHCFGRSDGKIANLGAGGVRKDLDESFK